MKRAWNVRDVRVGQRIMQRLASQACLDTRDLQVQVRNGKAILWGWVRSEGEIQVAAAVARSVPGVAGVECALQLAPRPTYCSDEEVAARVLGQISQDADIDADRLSVRVEAGDVLLTGWVADAEQYRNAESNAWWTVGVLNVINHLRVGEGRSEGLGDRAIAETLMSELIHSPRVDTGKVQLSVDGRVVTFWGTVPSAAQRQALAEIARSLPGVSRVVNRVKRCEAGT